MSAKDAAAQVRSIQCSSCGAPLNLHGGHKIRSLNCEYCGAVMDARNDYKTLAQFKDQIKPLCPFEIGMQGEIKGVNFTITGIIGWHAQGDHWVDLMLFSPTHGYAWLSYSRPHAVFVRRVRDLPASNIWRLTTRQNVVMGKQRFKVFERYAAEISYVAGELTWIAKVGDSTMLLDAIAPPFMLTAEKGKTESEYYLSEYLDQQALFIRFGAEQPVRKGASVHPAQPYNAPFMQAMSKAAKPFTAIAAAIVVILTLFFNGGEVYSGVINPQDLLAGQQTAEFTISRPDRLVKLDLSTTLRNAWVYLDVSVEQGEKVVYTLGKGISYYEGRDSDGSWSEGSTHAKAYFKAPQAGSYSLNIKATEGGSGESGRVPPQTKLHVKVREGYVSPFYFVLLALLMFAMMAVYKIGGWLFEGRRWKPVLADDD